MRRQQVAETRERIIAAGSELVHELPSWDWSGLTFRAVAERAGVGERTVYRHFPTERLLHDAIMQRLEQEAGVDYETVTLDTIGTVTERILASLSAYAAAPITPQSVGASLDAEGARRRDALRRAVADGAPDWTDDQREAAAAALDVVWSPAAYEQLVAQWRLDPERATSVVRWLLTLVVREVESDGPPPLR